LTKEGYTRTKRYTYVHMNIQYTHFIHILLILYTLPKNSHRNCLEIHLKFTEVKSVHLS